MVLIYAPGLLKTLLSKDHPQNHNFLFNNSLTSNIHLSLLTVPTNKVDKILSSFPNNYDFDPLKSKVIPSTMNLYIKICILSQPSKSPQITPL